MPPLGAEIVSPSGSPSPQWSVLISVCNEKHVPIGQLATMICFNADFTDVARRYGNQGAQLIAIPSLFGGPIAELTYTQIVFCAIGNRTAIIMADVPLGMGRTLYSQIGGLFGWFSLAGMAFFILLMNSKHPENKMNPLSQKQRQHSQ